MLTRREWLGTAAMLGCAAHVPAAVGMPIIDTHTHFYDPTRPEGVPWPGKGDPVLSRPVLPAEFVKLTQPLGVTGTVVVEASPWIEDNQWLLDLAKTNPVIVGVVGRLLPSDADFAKHLARFVKNPKYRGIRINQNEVRAALESPAQLDRLKAFSDAGLSLDVNGGPPVLADAAKLAEKLPKLTIIVNHLGNPLIDGQEPPKEWRDGLTSAAAQPNVWCKLSALVDSTRKRERGAPTDLAFYRPVFDAVWKAFGRKRLMFGSNWPVSDHYATYPTLFALASKFVKAQDTAAFADVFGGNAVTAYQLKVAR